MSDRSQIDEIKERLDIVSVVQEYVPNLKKSGRDFFAPCPFHQEKTPSFSVNSELGLFKCFGCGEGGDVIKFIEKIEGLDFPHALEAAAKRAGVELKKFSDPQLKKQRAEKDQILELNALVAKYFNFLLTEHKTGEQARQYIKQRKLTKSGIDTYQLGFAPVGFENLKKFLINKGYTEAELVKWGLLASKNGRNYDKFRNRLMFPIIDHQGEVVGFSGRSIDPNDKGPKYLNSPETPVYNKSKLLYGLFQAKEAIRKKDFAIIVEGNIDIISSYQAGVKNIVAPLGTALTEDQMRLLKRYCSSVYFAFDTDAAGQKALLKSLELAEKTGMAVRALDIGKYKDVDELIVSGGDWQKVVDGAKPVIDFLITQLSKSYDMEDSRQKAQFSRQILAFISKVENDLERTDYLEKLSQKAKVDREVLLRQMQPLSNSPSTSTDKEHVKKPVFELTKETYLLALIIQHERWLAEVKELISARLFRSTKYAELFTILIDNRQIPASLTELYNNLGLVQIEIFGDKKEFITELESISKRLQVKALKKELHLLKYADETEENLTRLSEITMQLAKLE